MSVADLTALITSITALIGVIGTIMAQISHLNWHKAAQQQPRYKVPPAGQQPPQS